MTVKEKLTGKTWEFNSTDEAREWLDGIGAKRANDKGNLYVFPNYIFYPDVSDDVSNAPVECFEKLRNELVKQTCDDWMVLYRSKNKEMKLSGRPTSLETLTKYIYSREFAQICSIEPDRLIRLMKEEAEKREKEE